MQRLTALFLMILISSENLSAQGLGSVQDWSKRVIELQEKEGQNFEQDLLLAKGYLLLQRRMDALRVLNSLSKLGKNDHRITTLYESAARQFFLQETSEQYADSIQFLKEGHWAEAKERIDAAVQKDSHHLLLVLRSIQLSIILGQTTAAASMLKIIEEFFPDSVEGKVYAAWLSSGKESAKVLSGIWKTSELAAMAYLKSLDAFKQTAELAAVMKWTEKNPHWVAVRLWKLQNKGYFPSVDEAEKNKEIKAVASILSDLSKLRLRQEKEHKSTNYFYVGIITPEKIKTQFEELVK